MVAKINPPQGDADAYQDWPLEVQLLAVIAGSELTEEVERTERRIRANDRWLGLAQLHKPDGFEVPAELPGLIAAFAMSLEKAHGVICGQARWGNLGILKTHAVLYFEVTGVLPDIDVLRSLWLARQHQPPMDTALVELANKLRDDVAEVLESRITAAENAMPIIDRRGMPLEENHPFKGARIIFGARRPGSEPAKSSGLTQEQEAANAENPSAAFELAAGNAYEAAMQKWARGEQGAEAPPPGGSTEGD